MKLAFPLVALSLFLAIAGCKRPPVSDSPGAGPATSPGTSQTPEPQKSLLPEGQPLTIESLDLKMSWIPAGKFIMGSPRSEDGHQVFEENMHQVIISRGFWIGNYEVTQAQFEKIMGENPSFWKDPAMPVNKVTWHDAMEFCGILSEQEQEYGRLPKDWRFILPTEAQWEYACRADSTTVYHFGNDREKLPQYAWYSENSQNRTKPVGLKKKSEWGLYDLHGNVGEWCFDWYGKKYPPEGSVDPITQKASDFKVFRGGTYADPPERCRAAYRNRNTPETQNPWIGFRVILSLQ
jgi:formylglycine-generating enzyme required for sulfatase activity